MPCSRTQHGLTRVGLEPPTSGSGVRGINHQTTALPYKRCWIRQTPSVFCKACKTNGLYGNPNPKNTLTAIGERERIRRNATARDSSRSPFCFLSAFLGPGFVLITGPCSSARVWSSTNDVCTLHFIHNHIHG